MDAITVAGVLEFEELEGGFWQLQLSDEASDLGERLVLDGVDEASARPLVGMRVTVRCTPRPDVLGFAMTGMHADVHAIVAAGSTTQ